MARPGVRAHSRTTEPPKLRAHWWLLATLLLVLALGLVSHVPGRLLAPDIYAYPEVGSAANVPASVRTQGPAFAPTSDSTGSIGLHPKQVAITFDDGPDPEWTPKVLEVLSRHNAHATFFLLGDRLINHPEVARQIVEQGSEVAVHGYSHADLGRVTPRQTTTELRLTQLMVAGATGQTTTLFRPPFSSSPSAVDDHQWELIRLASEAGYVTVLTTADTRDWDEPPMDELVAGGVPTGDSGIVLMHDGGGDRQYTVEGLDRILTELERRGFQAGTASQALGLVDANRPAPVATQALGTAILVGLGWAGLLDQVVKVAMIVAGLLALVRALVLVATAIAHWGRRRHEARTPQATADVGLVTVIVPAYNESSGIAASVRTIAASTHPVEIIVVDDGSTDDTAEIARGLGLPNVRVVTKPNGGKPSALNTGLQHARTEIVVMVDGDTIFEPDTVAELVKPFADPGVGAVAGNAKVANRKGLLGRWQHIEYVVAFNMDRRFYDLARCMPTVPGAVGAWRRDALLSVGGVSRDTLAEDTDLTMALGRSGWRIAYAENARAWTEVPMTLPVLWKQRYRWCYGTFQAMWKHRHGLVERGPGGHYMRRCLSYMTVFQVIAPLVAPAVDLFALYGLLVLNPLFTITVWASFLVVELTLTLIAFLLDRERPTVLWAQPLTQFCYRQMTYLVTLQSLATAVAGTRLKWQTVQRFGTFADGGSLPANVSGASAGLGTPDVAAAPAAHHA